MLKTVSNLVGLSGTLAYQGLWNASTNTPTLTSSVGTLNNYYVVSVAGSTNLNGITTWNVGDWAIFNGTTWERLDGGAYGAVSQVGGNGTVNGITLTGDVTSAGNLTLGGTLSNVANSQLSNSSTTLGNATLVLGSVTSSVGNLTLSNVTITSGSANGISFTNATAVTLPYFADNTAIATTAFTQSLVQATMSTLPMNLGINGGGTFSFDSIGTGCIIAYAVAGGGISGVLTIAVGGSGYQVGDLLNVNAGNGDAMLRVSSVSSGAVTGMQVVYSGTGYTTAGGGSAVMALGSLPYTFTLTGALTSNATIVTTTGTYLTQSNQWCVNNNTTGPYSVTFKLGNGSGVAIGTGVVIPQGTNSNTSCQIQTDGENDIWLLSVPVGPTTGTGSLVYSNNATLSNVTIVGGNVTANTVTANNHIATANIAVSSNAGAFSYGNLSYSDVGLVASFANSANSSVQFVIQNTDTASNASTDLVVVNDTGVAYGDFGITASDYSGTGAFYKANVVYVYSGSTDLYIGTISNNATHFVANNATTDAMVLNANNTVTINAYAGTTNTNASFTSATMMLTPVGYLIFNINGTNYKIPYYNT